MLKLTQIVVTMLFLGGASILAALTDMNIYAVRVLLLYVEIDGVYFGECRVSCYCVLKVPHA